MLSIIIALLIICWLIGLLIHLGGGFIHLLIVLALLILVIKLIRSS